MIKNHSVLCVIPARKNSKGLKNKNFLKLGNKRLIQYPIGVAKKSKYIDKIIFSSDSRKYINLAIKDGAEAPFLRPKKLSTDKTKTFHVVNHAIKYLEQKNLFFDIVVCLEPTSPFTTTKDLDLAIELLVAKKADSLVTVFDSGKYSINFHYFLKKQYIKPLMKNYDSPRQLSKKTVLLDGSLYIAKIAMYRKYFGFITNNTIGLKIEKWKNLEIDDIDDLKIARAIKRIYENKKNN